MKICLLVSKSDIGGATVYVHNLLEQIECETDLIYLYKGDLESQIGYRGKHISNRETIGTRQFPILIRKLIKELKARKYDLINVHSTEASIILRISLLFLSIKPRVVYTVHGWGWRGFGSFKSYLIKLIEYSLSKLIPVTYVFLYNKMRDECSFIHNIDYRNIISGITPPKEIRKYEIPKDRKPTFLFVARVDRAKDHKSALQILLPFKERKLKLVFVGAQTDSEDFKKKMNFERSRLGLENLKIEFKGISKNIKEHYQLADFVLLLSHFEALPLTVIEALSYGIPCIVSNVGGNKDLIKDEINGIVTEKNNELNEKGINFILNCLNNAIFYKQVCIKAREKFNEDLSIQSMTKKYQVLFNHLLKTK